MIKIKLGEKIRYLRELKGLSLAQLSEKCGLSIPYLSDIENSKKNPSVKSLDKLASSLGTDSSFLIRNTTTFEAFSQASGYEPPEDIIRFITNKEKLPYIRLAKTLDEEGVSPETMKTIIDIFLLGWKSTDNK